MGIAINPIVAKLNFERWEREGRAWIEENMPLCGYFFICGICGQERLEGSRSEHFGDICRTCVRGMMG